MSADCSQPDTATSLALSRAVWPGIANRYTGRYAEAIAALKEAVSRSPNFIAAYVNLARSYWEQWLTQQSPAAQWLEPAVAAVHRALAINDSWHWSHIN
jgi:tetratricopeptide (TPR) repeat protein